MFNCLPWRQALVACDSLALDCSVRHSIQVLDIIPELVVIGDGIRFLAGGLRSHGVNERPIVGRLKVDGEPTRDLQNRTIIATR